MSPPLILPLQPDDNPIMPKIPKILGQMKHIDKDGFDVTYLFDRNSIGV